MNKEKIIAYSVRKNDTYHKNKFKFKWYHFEPENAMSNIHQIKHKAHCQICLEHIKMDIIKIKTIYSDFNNNYYCWSCFIKKNLWWEHILCDKKQCFVWVEDLESEEKTTDEEIMKKAKKECEICLKNSSKKDANWRFQKRGKYNVKKKN